jgi:hypothetical protein
MHPLEKELLEAEFEDLLHAVEKDDLPKAISLAKELRGVLDRMDPSFQDETMDWLSERIVQINDPDLFDKTVEFMVEHELAEDEGESPGI